MSLNDTKISRMQICLDRLNIPLKVMWIPKTNCAKHGEIASDRLLIYDVDEEEMWLTFQHEVYEFKLREVTCVYQGLVNCLIENFERLVYQKKEKYINSLPKIAQIISEEKVQER